jgi:diguanylate cyclase (GGDEF)-like protein
MPVLLLVYVFVVYILPVARQGASTLQPTPLVMLIIASVILAVSGTILIATTSRRLGSIAASLAAAAPPPPGVRADELAQVETAARRLKGVIDHQKAEILQLRQEQAQLRQDLQHSREEAERVAAAQPVPGTWDLDGWQGYLDQEVERSRRYHRHFCVLFLQLERFAEAVNRLPTVEREEIARSITERLRSWVRLSDLMAGSPQQYFVMLLPETEVHGGRKVAERMVARLCDGSFVTRSALQGISFAASAGLACFPDDARDSGGLIECARAALAAACTEGNGAVAIYDKNQRKSGDWPPASSQ